MSMSETEFNMATRAPQITEIPACFDLPADLAKAVKARDTAWDAWVEVEDAATGAWLAVDQAARDDRKALVEAVAAGSDDPGEEATRKAERALVVALERVRQTRGKVLEADSEVQRLYRAKMLHFIPQATAHAREGVERYRHKYEQAKALLADAEQGLKGAFAGLNEVRDYVAPVMLYTPPSVLPQMRWNDGEVLGLYGLIGDLCERIESYTVKSGLTEDQLKAKLERRGSAA